MEKEPGLFSPTCSIDVEFKKYVELNKSDPEQAKALYSRGEQLIKHAASGEYRHLQLLCRNLKQGDVMLYFVAKSLVASLQGGHLMISTYIFENGYPTGVITGLPSLLHLCLKDVDDERCVPIIRLLVSKGLDINTQVWKS